METSCNVHFHSKKHFLLASRNDVWKKDFLAFLFVLTCAQRDKRYWLRREATPFPGQGHCVPYYAQYGWPHRNGQPKERVEIRTTRNFVALLWWHDLFYRFDTVQIFSRHRCHKNNLDRAVRTTKRYQRCAQPRRPVTCRFGVIDGNRKVWMWHDLQ
jgi:hypothetical protein